MRKYFLIISVVALVSVFWGRAVVAATLPSQTITLQPGWNIVSTPRVVDHHVFSAPETTANFSIFVLDPSKVSGWATMADLGQQEFTPLFGYFINNETATLQALTLYYASTTSPNQRLFSRTFTTPGWYSIGVANPTYARGVCDDPGVDTNNVSPLLYSLNGDYSYVLDVTDGNSFLHPNSPAVASQWKMVTAQDVNSLNDFRETKGYAVYITNASSSLTGFENTQDLAACDPAVFDQRGGLTVALDPASPTGYVVAGENGVTVAKFDLTPAGEPIVINGLDVNMSFSQSGTSSVSNLKLIDDQGVQIGATQTAVSSTASLVPYQNLNYTIPANTTRAVSVKVDLAGDATGTLQFGLSNIQAQGALSLVNSTTSGQFGNALTIITPPTNLTAYLNGSFGSPVLMAGSTANIASFVLQAGQVNSALLGGVNLSIPSNVPAGWLSNLSVNVNGTQMGIAQGNVTAGGSYSFTANAPLVIAANSSVTVDVYASLSNAASSTSFVLANLASVNATAGNNSVNITPIGGQAVSISQGNKLTSVTLDSSSPAATVMGMGTNSNTLAVYRLNGNANGPVTVTQLTVQDGAASNNTTTNATSSAFNNFTLVYNGNVLNAQPSLNASGTATFVFGSPITIAQNQYATVSLVGNAATYNSVPGAEASQHSFQAVSYVANLTTGATTTNVLNSANGNNITLYRTMLSGFSAGTVSPVTSVGSVGTLVSAFNVGAATGNDVYLQNLVVSQSGSVVSSTTALKLDLIDSSQPNIILASTTLTGTGTSSVDILNAVSPYSTGTAGWDIPANSTRTLQFKVEAVTDPTQSATNNNGTYQISISGVTWGDGSKGGLTVLPTTITLPIPGPVLTNLSN